MERLQFYPTPEELSALTADANKRGTSVSALLREIVDKYYSLNAPNNLTEAEIESKVLSEVESYVKAAAKGTQFDLNRASVTYGQISMVNSGSKPSVIRARLGKVFANAIGKTPFESVEVVRLENGKIKRTTSNRAAIYRIK